MHPEILKYYESIYNDIKCDRIFINQFGDKLYRGFLDNGYSVNLAIVYNGITKYFIDDNLNQGLWLDEVKTLKLVRMKAFL